MTGTNGETKLATATGSEFLGLTKREFEYTVLPEGKFRLCSLCESERCWVEQADPEARRRRLLCVALRDDNGHRILTDDQEDEIKKVNGRVAGRLFEVAMRLSGYGEDDFVPEDEVKN